METLWLVVGGVIGLAAGTVGGFKVGAMLRGGPGWRYWLANAVAMLTGMVLVFVGTVWSIGFLWTAGLGFMGAGITGLKYGYGKSVGVWRAIDSVTRTDDLPRE